VNVADVTASVNSLVSAQRMASTELQQLTPDDPLVPHLEAFTTRTTPQVDKLKQLHQDLLAELASLSTFFAEKPDQPVEEIFTTILSFSLTLQKASVEMSKYPDPPKKVLIPVLHTITPSSGSDTTPTATLARRTGLGTGTMTRGELDEAIRSIHGGVRRRERREASMTSTAGSSVKLSRMFLDGAGSSVRATVGRGAVSKRTRLGSVFN
jgi:diaphanous 1